MERTRIVFLAPLILLLLGLPLFAAAGPKEPAPTPTASKAMERIVLKAVFPFPLDWSSNDGMNIWIDLIKKWGRGRVEIKVLGGPEVVPTFGLPDALKAGTIDLFWWPFGYAETKSPAGRMSALLYLPPKTSRKNGMLALLDEAYREAAGLTALGYANSGCAFSYFTRKPVRSLEEMKGMKMRAVVPLIKPVEKALGITTVSIPAVEAVAALERGVVDGLSFSGYLGYGAGGFDKVVPYRCGPWFGVSDGAIFMAAKKYDSLPADVREILTKTLTDAENIQWYYFRDLSIRTERELMKAGRQFAVKWSAEDNRVFHDLMYKENIKWIEQNVPPKYSRRGLPIVEKYWPILPEPVPYAD